MEQEMKNEKLVLKLTLDNGTIIDNVEVNGTNLLTILPMPSDFKEHLSKVSIETNKGETYYFNNLVFIQSYQDKQDHKYHTALTELSQKEIREREIDSKFDFICMMTGIDL